MKKKFYPEGRMKEIYRIKENNYLADRLKLAKPAINSSCPKTFDLFRKTFPKSHEKGIMSKYFFFKFLFFSKKCKAKSN